MYVWYDKYISYSFRFRYKQKAVKIRKYIIAICSLVLRRGFLIRCAILVKIKKKDTKTWYLSQQITQRSDIDYASRFLNQNNNIVSTTTQHSDGRGRHQHFRGRVRHGHVCPGDGSAGDMRQRWNSCCQQRIGKFCF